MIKSVVFNTETGNYDMFIDGEHVGDCFDEREAKITIEKIAEMWHDDTSKRIIRSSTKSLLRSLSVTILNDEDGICSLSLKEIPDIIVYVRSDFLRQWCINRIESRRSHRNKPIRSQGGATSFSNNIRSIT